MTKPITYRPLKRGNPLSSTYQPVLGFMLACLEDNHGLPTCREIADHMGWRSPNMSHMVIESMESAGLIERTGRNRSRGYRLVGVRVRTEKA